MEEDFKNTQLEAQQRKKTMRLIFGVGVVFLFLVFSIFFLKDTSVSETQDIPTPIKIAESEKQILLKNPRYANGDLDAIFDEQIENDVLRFDLKSHPNIKYIRQVGVGNQVVMWYDVNSVYQLENALGTPEFIDMKTEQRVERDWKYVYLTNETYESPVYSETISVNGTITKVQTGTQTKTRETWLPYNSRDLPKGQMRIGIEVNNLNGDRLDGIWVVGGKRIDRHAIWTASLETDLYLYFDFDETSGTVIENVSSLNTTTTGTQGVTGLRGNSIRYPGNTGTGTYKPYVASINEGSINFWVNTTDTAFTMWTQDGAGTGNNVDGILSVASGNQVTCPANTICFEDGDVNTVTFSATSIRDGNWHMLTLVVNGTHHTIYIDGAFQNTTASTTNIFGGASGDNGFIIGSSDYIGNIDLFGVWNRSLSVGDISILYNDGFGCDYLLCNSTAPVLDIDLLSPANNTLFSTATNFFSANVTSQNAAVITIANVSLIINGTFTTQTNTSGIEGIYNFSETLSDGDYNWTVQAFGNDSVQYNASNGTLFFTVDTINPVLNVGFPNETITFHERNTNLFLNWSVNDTNLDVCLFQYRNINTTVTCVNNQTTFNITDNINRTLIFFANDTAGNIVSQNVSWNYRLFLQSETFDASVFEGLSTTFSANFLTNGSSITQANLSYDASGNLGTISNHGGNNFTVRETIIVPSVSADENKAFFWNITQGSFFHALASQNQLVQNLGIDDCSTNNATLYNFTIQDEANQSILNASSQNTTARLNLQVYGFGTTTLIQEFNQTYTEVNPFTVCLSTNLSGGGQFTNDLQVQYLADDYSEELFHIQNETINSTTFNQNITLRDLNESDAQIFKIIFRDSSFLPVEDALVEISRKYISENEFKITEIPMTDSRGEAVAHLVINNVIYQIEVIKFGTTLATFSDVVAVCQIPLVQSCEIDLNAFSDTIDLPDFEEAEDFSFTLGYDNATRVVSSVFSIPSGTIAVVSLNVTREDALGTAVCSNQLVSSSGTLTCTVPASFGNSTIRAELYKANSLQAQGNIKLNQNPIDLYGVTLVGLSIFIMITLIGVSISNSPVITTLFLMLGVVLLFSLNLVANSGFIGATATILWLAIAMIILLIKGVKRN